MKYVPVMGIILSQLALRGVADKKYADDIAPMNIERGVLVHKDEAHLKAPAGPQRLKMARELFCH